MYADLMRLPAYLLLCLCTLPAQQSVLDEAMRKAHAAQQRGELAEALKGYQLVIQGRPDLVEARIQVASILVQTGRLDEAIAALQPVADKPGVRKNLAIAYYRKPDVAAAIGEFEKLSPAERSDPATLSVLADCYLRTGAPANALRLLEPAVREHRADARLQYQFGMARLRTGDATGALDALERAGKLGRLGDAYLLAGATALELGEFSRARADLENAVRINPKTPGAWTWTAMARDRVSDEEGAKQAYRSALELDPSDFEANLHLGAVLYRERDLDGATRYLERALTIRSNSSLARYAVALVRAAKGQIDQSLRDLEAVTSAEPDWLEPHVKLASLYFREHRETEARRQQSIIEKLQSEHREKKVPLPEVR
jgi:tetratricopeptide (TPR) repeat protein